MGSFFKGCVGDPTVGGEVIDDMAVGRKVTDKKRQIHMIEIIDQAVCVNCIRQIRISYYSSVI